MATAPEEIEQVAKTSKVETPEAARESEPNGVVESIKDDIMEEEKQVVSQTKIDGKKIFFLIFLAVIFFVQVILQLYNRVSFFQHAMSFVIIDFQVSKF